MSPARVLSGQARPLPGTRFAWAALATAPAGWRSGLAASDSRRLRAVRHPHQHELSALAVVLLRQLVGEHRGTDPLAVPLRWECPACGGTDHGRPLVGGAPALGASAAHAGGLVVVALREGGDVGVDVEVAADHPDHPDHPAHGSATARGWVRSEAALKALGRGLDADPAAALRQCRVVDVDLPGEVAVVAALALRVRG